MVNARDVRRYAAEVLPVLGVAAIYFAGARIGLLQELVGGQVTPLWPPTGIALVALLRMGVRIWPGIALGAFVVNATIGSSILVAAGIAAGNTLAPVCAYLLLRRVGFRIELDRRRDALALVFLGALAGMAISATLGSSLLYLSGSVDAGDFLSTWSVWWTGDAMGVLVVAPFLLVLRRARMPRGVPLLRLVEAVALGAGTFLVTLLATTSSVNLLFLVLPFLVWAALRFQLAGAAPCALLVSTVAIVAAGQGSGPFSAPDLLTTMVTLQAFNGSMALTALVLSGIIAERNTAHQEIEAACLQLETVVTQLGRGRATEQGRILIPERAADPEPID